MPWCPDRVSDFVAAQYDAETAGYRSVAGGTATLYGTCYALLTFHYLGQRSPHMEQALAFVRDCQDQETGYFVGPELRNWSPPDGGKFSREHLLMHATCAALPVLQQYGEEARWLVGWARPFLDVPTLIAWLNQRNWADAWLEGNNILFVGQILVYLRDVEHNPAAEAALAAWFDWLDEHVDPRTGLWGTGCGSSAFTAMCGGYHQLLVYYHDRRRVAHPERLVDTVLSLQHLDGGFSPRGGGGACEDVDAVDILVNLYKLLDYRRAAIRHALRRCLRHIAGLQNEDGGFPYKRGEQHSHMGIPSTRVSAGGSAMFPTWFRVHTLALIKEILPDVASLRAVPFRFTDSLSMGWHRKWIAPTDTSSPVARIRELPSEVTHLLRRSRAGVRGRVRGLVQRGRRIARTRRSPTGMEVDIR